MSEKKVEEDWERMKETCDHEEKTWRQECVWNVTMVHLFLNQRHSFEKLTQ